MTVRRIAAAAALWTGALASTAASAQAAKPCLLPREAEAIVLTMAPQLLTTAATACTATLPASAYLRRPADRLTGKFAAEGDAAWPLAKAGLAKLIGGGEGAAMLDSELARPMLGSMVAPMLTKGIKPRDCGAIDRVLALLDPLPARNTASLIVTIAELSLRDRPGRGRDFSICAPTTP